MDIGEAQERVRVLEGDIAELLNLFCQETGLCIRDVGVMSIVVGGVGCKDRRLYDVDIRVEL